MADLLKFITCGSVDDGKSTLIGHMLYDAKLIFTDQERALELDSKVGSAGGGIDYSLLLDGLMAEREQGINRCSIQILYDRKKKHHSCRHTRPRGIHKKYGGGRIICRPCGNPCRCLTRSAGADQKTRAHMLSDGNTPFRNCSKQNGPYRLQQRKIR